MTIRSGERVRSWLFAPATDGHKCRKALASAADQVIWDLEDAVADEDKERARCGLVDLVADLGPTERRPWVRINSPLTPEGEADLRMIEQLTTPITLPLVVPKADAATVDRLDSQMGADRRWLLLIETAAGMWDLGRGALAAPAGASIRLAFGALDYALDLGIEPQEDERELLFARSQIVVGSRALGLGPPIDSVYPGFTDLPTVTAAARRGRALGFAGKLAIHPAQIAAIERAFAPTAAQLAWARRVEAAVAGGIGATQVDGAMVDRPVIENARAILADAEETAPKVDGPSADPVNLAIQANGPSSEARSC